MEAAAATGAMERQQAQQSEEEIYSPAMEASAAFDAALGASCSGSAV